MQPLHIAVVYSSITRGQIKGTVRVCVNLLSMGGEPSPIYNGDNCDTGPQAYAFTGRSQSRPGYCHNMARGLAPSWPPVKNFRCKII